MPTLTVGSVGGPSPRIALLSLRGEFDLVSHQRLRGACRSLLTGAAPAALIDLSEVRFLDCGTVGILDVLAWRLREEGRPTLTVTNAPFTRSVLGLAGYVPAHDVVRTVPEALTALGFLRSRGHQPAPALAQVVRQ